MLAIYFLIELRSSDVLEPAPEVMRKEESGQLKLEVN